MTRRRGLSVIEVLLVIGIIAVLVGLTIPAVMRVRHQAAKSACQNNLHNQAHAIFSFESATGRWPPGAIFGPFEPHGVPENTSHGLWPCVVGWLDSQSRAGEYRWDVAYSAEENQPVVRAAITVLLCPGSEAGGEVFFRDDNDLPTRWGAGCNFGPVQPSAIFADLGWSEPDLNYVGALPPNAICRPADVQDGLSHTILLAEQGDRGAAWCSPNTLVAAREVFPGGRPGAAPHVAGLNIAFCDGSTRLLRWDLSPRIYAALCTRAGGESTTGFDD